MRSSRAAAVLATLCAVLVLAVQVGGKAARDAIFLSRHSVTLLPLVTALAGVVSIAAAVLFSRLVTRLSPARVVPPANVLSAALLVLEWALDGRAPGAIAVVIYLHLAAAGGVLVSGFWSLINERFDPRSARRYMAIIGVGAALGGVAGGFMATGASGLTDLLPFLAALQLIVAGLLRALASGSPPASAEEAPVSGALRALRASPQLARMALLVFLAALSAALLDYVFKAGIVGSGARGGAMLRAFAAYYATTGVVTLLVQMALGRLFVERLGPGASLATLPGAVLLGCASAALAPGALVRGLARGAEQVLRSSIFRSGYELLFAPLPERDKRATKTLIDVAVDRLGDVAGALVISGAVAAGLASERVLLVAAALISAGALAVTYFLHRGQAAALAQSLRRRSPRPELSVVSLDLTSLAGRMTAQQVAVATSLETLGGDPLVAALRSRDKARVTRALAMISPLPWRLVADVIPLLGWDDVAAEAAAALSTVAARVRGQLLDHLLDPDEEFAVRRRLPAILELSGDALAAWGLVRALADSRFEVRYRCARALHRLRRRDPELELDTDRVLQAVRQELEVEQRQPLLDKADGDDAEPDRGVEHIFRLLSLALPGEPFALAFRGLRGGDAHLRGTALEYLDTALPDDVRRVLWPVLERHDRAKAAPQPREGT